MRDASLKVPPSTLWPGGNYGSPDLEYTAMAAAMGTTTHAARETAASE
ncbi:hypothetical protein [Acidilobus sp.]